MSMPNKRLFLAAGSIILMIIFTELALHYQTGTLLSYGHSIQSMLYNIGGLFWETFFIFFTYVGSGYISYPLTALLAFYFVYRKYPWVAGLLIFNLIGVRRLNWLLKTIVERPRPDLDHLIAVHYYSFPSGHAMNSTAFFGFLAYLLHLHLKRTGKSSVGVWLAAFTLIFLIGLSRIYLGVHYPMDVLGGFLAGGAWLLITLFLYTFIPEKGRSSFYIHGSRY